MITVEYDKDRNAVALACDKSGLKVVIDCLQSLLDKNVDDHQHFLSVFEPRADFEDLWSVKLSKTDSYSLAEEFTIFYKPEWPIPDQGNENEDSKNIGA